MGLGYANYNFSQQSIQNDEVYFITNSEQSPSFQVSVWNGRLHCQGCPKPAEVIAPSDPSKNPLLSDKWLLALTVVAIPALKFGLKHMLNRRFTLQGDFAIDNHVTRVVLLDQLWIGLCGIFTWSQFQKYQGAIGKVINEIENPETKKDKCPTKIILRENWNNFDPEQKKQVSIEIGAAIKDELKINKNAW